MTTSFQSDGPNFFGHPKPLRGLFLSELWERFSFYGIRPLLILYMSAMTIQGGLGLDRSTAAAIVGIFAGTMYLITIFGGWIADRWLGQARAVWYGSLLIAIGHLSIALTAWFDSLFFYLGLVFIVLGTGLFKTCISVIVGTLYSAQDSRRDAGFSIFYMGINLGSFLAPLLTGLLVQNYGWHIGFGIGGIGMLISLLTFRFISIPELNTFNQAHQIQNTWNSPTHPNTNAPKIVTGFLVFCTALIVLIYFNIIKINPVILATYLTVFICTAVILYFAYLLLFTKTTIAEKKQLIICFILLLVAALFWSTFEQQPTSFNLFAQDFTDRNIAGFEIPTVWFQALNPIFIILCAPIFAWLWVKLGKSNQDPSYISKFIFALIFAAIGFTIMIFASQSILANNSATVSPLWIVASLFFLTLGELCLSPVGLSTMTKLAPNFLRGQVMGLWFTAVALGNLVAGLIGGHVAADAIQNLPSLFMRCVFALILGAFILFLLKKPILKLISDSENQSSTVK
jgi:proton-dependent oligopeptide transporter, POT family